MKVERVTAFPLTKRKGAEYAVTAVGERNAASVESVKYLGGGSFGRAYRIAFADGGRIVVKLLRAGNMMQKEVRDLGLIRKYCTVSVPRVLFSREADDAIPVDLYAMDLMKGKNVFLCLSMLFQGRKKRLRFADEVTSALHAVHGCVNEYFGDTAGATDREWTDFYKPFAAEVLAAAERECEAGKLSPKVIAVMRAAWERFGEIFEERVERACLVHGDLNVANIMVGKNGRLKGFIDPFHSLYADPEYDLFQFNNLTGKRFFLAETYRRKYGESAHCDAKLAFYGLWNEVFCLIRTGVSVGFLMRPLVKNLRRRLSEL